MKIAIAVSACLFATAALAQNVAPVNGGENLYRRGRAKLCHLVWAAGLSR